MAGVTGPACYRRVLEIIDRTPDDFDPEYTQRFIDQIAKLDPPQAPDPRAIAFADGSSHIDLANHDQQTPTAPSNNVTGLTLLA